MSQRCQSSDQRPYRRGRRLHVAKQCELTTRVEIGDAVYASRTKNFWPAVLTGFQPALTGEQKKLHGDRYDVEFQLPEFGKKSLRRKEVIFMTDEGIADCTVSMAIPQRRS